MFFGFKTTKNKFFAASCTQELCCLLMVDQLSIFANFQFSIGASKKTGWWGAGVVICLERDADLHMAQLMPLPLTVSCFSKIQTGFTFLVLAHPGSLNMCVCVCVFQFSIIDSSSVFYFFVSADMVACLPSVMIVSCVYTVWTVITVLLAAAACCKSSMFQYL